MEVHARFRNTLPESVVRGTPAQSQRGWPPQRGVPSTNSPCKHSTRRESRAVTTNSHSGYFSPCDPPVRLLPLMRTRPYRRDPYGTAGHPIQIGVRCLAIEACARFARAETGGYQLADRTDQLRTWPPSSSQRPDPVVERIGSVVRDLPVLARPQVVRSVDAPMVTSTTPHPPFPPHDHTRIRRIAYREGGSQLHSLVWHLDRLTLDFL